jgi:hypothetical protein
MNSPYVKYPEGTIRTTALIRLTQRMQLSYISDEELSRELARRVTALAGALPEWVTTALQRNAIHSVDYVWDSYWAFNLEQALDPHPTAAHEYADSEQGWGIHAL